MAEVGTFLAEHWGLTAAFVGTFVALIVIELRVKLQQSTTVAPQKVVQLMNHEKAVILDIRDKEAFKAGHIVSALHYPADTIINKIRQLEKYRQRPVLVVCENGRESLPLRRALQQKGFERALQLAGGMAAWRTEGMPVSR